MKNAIKLFLLFIAISSYAQINYKPGYFITNDGTKTDCLIKDIGWKSNPLSFDYKISDNEAVKTGTMQDVAEFEVADTKYVRLKVEIDRSEMDIDRLSTARDPEFKPETLYLKVLVSGKAQLYEYEDGNLTRFFYSKESTARQLVYKHYKEGSGVAINTEFRGQLYQIMNERFKDPGTFKSIRYESDDLVKLFSKYDDDGTGKAVVHASKANNSEFHLKVTPGFTTTSISINVDDGNGTGVDFKNKIMFRIGFEAEFILPVNNKKWALFVDPNFYQYKNTGISERPAIAEVKKWDLTFKYFEIPIGLRYYMHLNTTTKLFVNAAYLTSFKIGGGQVAYGYNNNYSNGYSVAKVSSVGSFAAGAGVSYKFISAEARVGFNHDILNTYPLWNIKYTSGSLIIGIRLL